MKSKEVIYGAEAKEALVEGIFELATVVATTMGPNGNNVIIPSNTEYGKFNITKDGVSVAKSISYVDHYKNISVGLVKEVAEETVRVAGDGTTTSIVLVAEFIKLLIGANLNNATRVALDKVIEDVIDHLDDIKKPVRLKDIKNVALVSANGDDVIATKIVEAYTNVKTKVNLYKSANTSTVDVVETTQGLYIPEASFKGNGGGYHKEWIKTDSYVVVSNKPITDLKMYDAILNKANKEGSPILIITPKIDDEILRILDRNRLNKGFDVCVIKTPGFADHRVNLLSDLATYCGCEAILESDTSISLKNIGRASKVAVTDISTVIYNETTSEVETLIQSLTDSLSKAKQTYDKELITQRVDRLNGYISTIYVGGHSEAEQSERYDRYDDAIRAVSCALEDGVIEGGGLALAKYAFSKGEVFKGKLEFEGVNVILNALFAPFNAIVSNGCEITLETDLLSKGIVDPVKVTKTALIKAYNFAKVIASTNAIVLGKNYE